MASERQIEANRLNAQKSTGPKTRKGKAICRLNAFRHGLRSSGTILPVESWHELLRYRDRFLQACQPQTMEEHRRVSEMACTEWKLVYWRKIRLELLRKNVQTPRAQYQRNVARLDRAIRLANQQLQKLTGVNPPEPPPAA
jgi:hypothetical protein